MDKPGSAPPPSLLVGENARRDDVDQAWEQDNQAWWDWYVSLAEPAPASADAAPIASSQPTQSVAATDEAL
ncbi:MAG: hypothetical protein AAFX85_10030, partial [Pseudomonadota bacterium]